MQKIKSIYVKWFSAAIKLYVAYFSIVYYLFLPAENQILTIRQNKIGEFVGHEYPKRESTELRLLVNHESPLCQNAWFGGCCCCFPKGAGRITGEGWLRHTEIIQDGINAPTGIALCSQ